MGGLKAVGVMVFFQVVFAGINILYKLAINDGMNSRVLVAYRFMFGAAFLVPLALCLERKSRPKLTWMVLLQGFGCGLFGGTLVQNLYIAALGMTSVTIVSTMTNLIPAITFIIAVSCRLERLAIRTLSGQAKVLGLLIGMGGAIILNFYKGINIKLWSSKINLLGSPHASSTERNSNQPLMGSLLALASCSSYAIWLIIQTKMIQRYPCFYSCTSIMCVMASIQSVAFTLCMDRNWSHWKLGWNIRLLTSFYSGSIGSGVVVVLMAWCINQQGPLFVSIFNPLMPIIVAILGYILLQEKLYLGSILGTIVIIIGLYMVLWGKYKETQTTQQLSEVTDELVVPETFEHAHEDLEASFVCPNGNSNLESKVSGKEGSTSVS